MSEHVSDLGVSYHGEGDAKALAAALRKAGREFALFDLGGGQWALVLLIPAMRLVGQPSELPHA